QVAQQRIAREEIGVRNGDLMARGSYADSVVLLDVVRVLVVIPCDPRSHYPARVLMARPSAPPQVAPDGRLARARREELQRIRLYLGHSRTANLHGIVLFGHRTILHKVVGAEVDAADKSHIAVDHHDLAL